MGEAYAFKVLSRFRKSLIGRNGKRLTRRPTDKNTLEGIGNKSRELFDYVLRFGDIAVEIWWAKNFPFGSIGPPHQSIRLIDRRLGYLCCRWSIPMAVGSRNEYKQRISLRPKVIPPSQRREGSVEADAKKCMYSSVVISPSKAKRLAISVLIDES